MSCFLFITGCHANITEILSANTQSDAFMAAHPVLIDLTAAFGAGNIELMMERSAGFTVPIPARNKIQKF